MRLAKTEEFDQIFAILEENFPRDEHRGKTAQRAILSDPRYRIYVEGKVGEIQGFIGVWQLTGVTFIEHFAVAAPFRNKGLGAKMLHELCAFVAAPLCLEVELPDTALARRRISFYERNGFFYNDYPYAQPAFSPDRAAVPLRLMTSSPLTAAEFKALKTVIYQEIYQVW